MQNTNDTVFHIICKYTYLQIGQGHFTLQSLSIETMPLDYHGDTLQRIFPMSANRFVVKRMNMRIGLKNIRNSELWTPSFIDFNTSSTNSSRRSAVFCFHWFHFLLMGVFNWDILRIQFWGILEWESFALVGCWNLKSATDPPLSSVFSIFMAEKMVQLPQIADYFVF